MKKVIYCPAELSASVPTHLDNGRICGSDFGYAPICLRQTSHIPGMLDDISLGGVRNEKSR